MLYGERAKIIGSRIKAERLSAGLTQKELLEKVYLSENSVASLRAWERGERLPDMDTVARMCELFDCDFGYMIGDYKEHDYSKHKICEATGLSETAVNILIKKNERAKRDRAAGWYDTPNEEELIALSALIELSYSILYHIYQYFYGDYESFELPGKTDDEFSRVSDMLLVSNKNPSTGIMVSAKDLQPVFLMNIQDDLSNIRKIIQGGLNRG